MTDKNLTEVVAIIDRSGSMAGLIDDTIGGFNTFLEEQKALPGSIKLTLVQFDHEYEITCDGLDINDVKPLTNDTYKPRGNTALFDAVGRTINQVGSRLSNTPEDKRPGQVIFVIITDGFENSSREFIGDKVREMVRHQSDIYSWSFVYLGGGDLDNQAKQIGISAANIYSYSASAAGTKNVYTNFSKGVARSRDNLSKGVSLNVSDSFLTPQEASSLKDD